jgi:putative ABC transport system permease protein
MGWLTRIANLFRRRDLNAEIDEELQFHLDARTEENVRDGMTPAEARRDALRRFGGRAGFREAVRDVNLVAQLERLWQDLRHGLRVFARNPGLTAIAVASIAFGTGANVAIFSVADSLLLRPLPVSKPSEVVSVGSRVRHGPRYRHAASYPDYLDLRDRATSFTGLAAYLHETIAFTLRPEDPPQARIGTFVSANFFDVLQVAPLMGRAFGATDDDRLSPGAVAMLSEGLWRAGFSADPDIVGRTLQVNGRELHIIGVVPAAFRGLDRYVQEAVFLPATLLPRLVSTRPAGILAARDARVLTVKGRLRPDVSLEQAQAELAALGSDLERLYPDTNRGQAVQVMTEFEHKVELRPYAALLVAALSTLSLAVFCVACANVAGLLASRGPARAREMALRLAIGASRPRLVRQLVTESLGIAIAGAVGGVGVAWLGIRLLRQVQYPTELFSHPPFELNERALIVGLVVAAASALLVGLGPALQTTRVDLVSSLKVADRESRRPRRRLSGRSTLVAVQVALSLVLLTITTWTIQLFSRELSTGPGFRITDMSLATVRPGQAGYAEPEVTQYLTRLLEDARALPGVHSASVTSSMPLFSFQFAPVLKAPSDGGAGALSALRTDDAIPTWANSVDGRYFETMAIPLLKGRTFEATDTATAPAVAIVNATLARRYWPDDDPLGRKLFIADRSRRVVEVIGVVPTTTYSLPGEIPQDAIYFPYPQRPRGEMVLVVHTALPSTTQLDPIGELVRRLDRTVPVSDVQTIETYYAVQVTQTGNVLVRLVGGMGLMGLLLTMVGLYGLVSYAVNRRTREIGIRIAIGATYARILRMVLQQGMLPAWLGLAAGFLLSAGAARLLARISPLSQGVDAVTYYVVVPLLLFVALAAALLPARRAARVNPTEALRMD